jgi:hypothetical protein
MAMLPLDRIGIPVDAVEQQRGKRIPLGVSAPLSSRWVAATLAWPLARISLVLRMGGFLLWYSIGRKHGPIRLLSAPPLRAGEGDKVAALGMAAGQAAQADARRRNLALSGTQRKLCLVLQ